MNTSLWLVVLDDTTMKYSAFLFLPFLHVATGNFVSYSNISYPDIPGLEIMSSDKIPHFTIIESVSKTKLHRHKRQVIAGPICNQPIHS